MVISSHGPRLGTVREMCGTDMFLSSLALAYLSSVVMMSSWPSLMGMSSSLGVFPVRISGPFYDGC